MSDDVNKLSKILGKAFRRAKRWYFAYLISQLAILILAIACISVELPAKLVTVIAFLCVLATECFRWSSDFWRSQGEWAKRKYEMADGLGIAVQGTEVADWLAGSPKGFLADVAPREIEGSEFDSAASPGPLRVVENTQESAWWSKYESRAMIRHLCIALILVVGACLVALTMSIGVLKETHVEQSGALVHTIGAVVCAILTFVLSINVVRLIGEFYAFARKADDILRRCTALLKMPAISERDALALMHDYQVARCLAPLLPTFIWRLYRSHLQEHWKCYRPSR